MAMQKHRAASICKSNSSLPEESQSDVGRWAVKLLLCSLPLSYYLVTYTISHGLPMLGRLLKAKTKLYLHLSALDVIQELHTLCSFTFYLAFVLFTKRDILSIVLHRLFDDCQSPLIMFLAIFHLKDFLILQFSPEDKQRQFLFMSQGRCIKHGTAI